MTISSFEIYFISLADKVRTFSETAIFLSFLFIGILSIFWLIAKNESCKTEDDEKVIKKLSIYLKRIAICFICCILINIFTPSSKTIAAMYLIPAIVNNEHIQNSTSNALKMLEELTKEWLEDFIKKEPKKDGIHT